MSELNNDPKHPSRFTGFIGLLAVVAGLILALLIIFLANQQTHSSSDSKRSDGANSLLDLLKPSAGQATAVRSDSFCALSTGPDNSCLVTQGLCAKDLEMARIAWKYFENNYHPSTGLYNAVDNYPSTTMWDTGSALAATLTARDLGFMSDNEFDGRINALLETLNSMNLFNGEAPNKVYNTDKVEMVDYANQPAPDGIGVSTLDLARLVSWLNTLSCMHPKYAYPAKKSIERWNFDRLIAKGQMYGLARDPVTQKIQVLQEGRLGYEQYAGKIFRFKGFNQSVSATYNNEYRSRVDIYGVPIAYDSRDPRELGAYNYVVTESYTMDAIENGLDDENRPLLENIYHVQKRRWEETGIVTAISEDNIDRKPYFLYNTIFTAGLPWNTTTDKGERYDDLKTTSVKAALSMAALFPDDPYSKELVYMVGNAYDPERGWYSGIYENGKGYNKAITANTNGIIMSLILNKKYGEFIPICDKCQRGIKLEIKPAAKTCEVCSTE